MRKSAVLGIDIGGTKTFCVLADRNAKTLNELKFKSAPDKGCKEFGKNLLGAVKSLRDTASQEGHHLAAVGIGCAGSIDEKNGVIKTSPNLLCLEGFHLRDFLKEEVKVPIALGNDVQYGICGEHQLGAAKGVNNVLGVFFGTGVGGAAIINGELYRGASGFGGQVGSILAQPVGGREAALSHGILDRIASKSAIATEALTMAVKDWAPNLHKKVDSDLSKVSWGAIRKAIAKGDNKLKEMLQARLKVVGIALSSVVNFMNPQMVVLGGGLVEEMPKIVMKGVEEGLREYLVPEVGKALKVEASRLGTAAVAWGGVCAALEILEEKK
jgi:glucokinase